MPLGDRGHGDERRGATEAVVVDTAEAFDVTDDPGLGNELTYFFNVVISAFDTLAEA